MTERNAMTERVDAVFRQFRQVFVPDSELCSGELKQDGRYYLALDPLSPLQALKNPRIGRYVLMRRETGTRHDDSILCMMRWIGHTLTGFYALSVVDGDAARVAWCRFAGGGSIRDCAYDAGISYRQARNYLTGENKPDLYAFWDDRFSHIATPGDAYRQLSNVSK